MSDHRPHDSASGVLAATLKPLRRVVGDEAVREILRRTFTLIHRGAPTRDRTHDDPYIVWLKGDDRTAVQRTLGVFMKLVRSRELRFARESLFCHSAETARAAVATAVRAAAERREILVYCTDHPVRGAVAATAAREMLVQALTQHRGDLILVTPTGEEVPAPLRRYVCATVATGRPDEVGRRRIATGVLEGRTMLATRRIDELALGVAHRTAGASVSEVEQAAARAAVGEKRPRKPGRNGPAVAAVMPVTRADEEPEFEVEVVELVSSEPFPASAPECPRPAHARGFG